MLVIALLSALLVGVACSFGDDGTYSPPVLIVPRSATPAVIPRADFTSQPEEHAAPSASVHPASLRTGIPAIDAVVRAVATHDAPAFAALLFIEPDACAAAPDDVNQRQCPDDTAPGLSSVPFMYSDCEFDSVRAGAPLPFARSLTADSALYAAFGLVDFQATSGQSLSGYSLVFDRPGQAWVVHIAATGGIIAVDLGCEDRGAAALVAELPVDKVILPPPDGMPPVEDPG
jgi:hypothetical protein